MYRKGKEVNRESSKSLFTFTWDHRPHLKATFLLIFILCTYLSVLALFCPSLLLFVFLFPKIIFVDFSHISSCHSIRLLWNHCNRLWWRKHIIHSAYHHSRMRAPPGPWGAQELLWPTLFIPGNKQPVINLSAQVWQYQLNYIGTTEYQFKLSGSVPNFRPWVHIFRVTLERGREKGVMLCGVTVKSWVFCRRYRVILLSWRWSGVRSTTEAPG